MSADEEGTALRRGSGPSETAPDDEDGNELPPLTSNQRPGFSSPFRTGSNLSEPRHSFASSSSANTTRLREGSVPFSPAQASRSSRAPSTIARERNRLGSSNSQVAVPNEQDNASTCSTEQVLEPGLEPVIPVLGTDHRLQNFELVISRASSSHPELVRQRLERREEIRRRQQAASEHRPNLRALQVWAGDEDERDTLTGPSNPLLRTLSNVFSQNGSKLPAENDLIKLAHHFFPPVGQIKVHVFDFGPNYSRHTVTTIGNIEEIFGSKPAEASVRWIHAPLGVGVTHSSVEELFLKAGPGPGKPFVRAGAAGWPNLSDTILEFHSQDYFKEKRDACILLKKYPGLSERLDETLFWGTQDINLWNDMKWRCDHVNIDMSYWNIEQSDMPWQLSEGIVLGGDGPQDGLKAADRTYAPQMFSQHPFYKQARARLVKTQIRTFHRDDGCLLTLTPMCGVNYLDKDFAEKVKEPPECRIDDESVSALARVWQIFEKTGTSTWPSETVEWFLVYLMTEISVTPHAVSQGFNAPSLHQAYQAIALDLKRRRFEKFERQASVRLVKDYITCIEELSIISDLLRKKVSFLERLRQDCEVLESEDLLKRRPSDDKIKTEKSMVKRVDWALVIVRDQYDNIRFIFDDLQGSMQALFQLKSIEQNELAIVADSQNNAVLVFAGVTTVFLPLSFFTSYFGMNLKGIADTDHTERYFWAVCGAIGFVLIILVLPIAFKRELRHLLRKNNPTDSQGDDDKVAVAKSIPRRKGGGQPSSVQLVRRMFRTRFGTRNDNNNTSASVPEKLADDCHV
ncbi:MAG: hypothetical protein M1837_005431 [Sclerophora amabilis]|nr:MAG: hypothetical protein M1837_005431 [Sclerophora amabilis]